MKWLEAKKDCDFFHNLWVFKMALTAALPAWVREGGVIA
jgi:hypothetical protein